MKDYSKTEVIKSEGIVIKSDRYGEADRLITVFTLSHGKLKAVARGARKVTSRYGAGVLPPSRIELKLARKSSGLYTVSGFAPLDEFCGIRSSTPKLSALLRILNIFDELTVEHNSNAEEYSLLLEVLAYMTKELAPGPVETSFILRFLELSGFGLGILNCAGCGKEYSAGRLRLSFQEGIVCSECAPSYADLTLFSEHEFLLLKRLFRGDLEGLSAPQDKIIVFIDKCLHYHLEKTLASDRLSGRKTVKFH